MPDISASGGEGLSYLKYEENCVKVSVVRAVVDDETSRSVRGLVNLYDKRTRSEMCISSNFHFSSSVLRSGGCR